MENTNPPKEVTFHYIKSAGFRVVHADGVWGGATPRGYVAMNFFSERAPIPKSLTHEIMKDGNLGEEKQQSSRDGFVREVEVEVLIDLAMARSLIPWLQEKINFFEQLNKQREGA